MKYMSTDLLEHEVARHSGVTAEDTPTEAAEKVYAAMVDSGFSERDLKKARKMIDDAKARGVL